MLRLRACRWQTPRFLWRRGGSKGYLRVRRRHTLHPARPHLFFAWRRGYQFGTHPTHLHKNSTVKSPTFEHTCSSRRKTSAPASSGESVGWLSPAPAQRGPAASICAQSHVDLSVSFRNLCLGFKSLVSRSILESTLRTQCVYFLTDSHNPPAQASGASVASPSVPSRGPSATTETAQAGRRSEVAHDSSWKVENLAVRHIF